MNSKQPFDYNTPKPSRRQIVKTGVAAGIAAWLSAGKFPAILHAEDKAGDKTPILGDGDHKFEWLGDWAQRPADKPWGNTHAVQETADGRIFVCHTGPESIHVYDPDGKFIEAWGKEYHGNAHGMDLRKENGEEFLYLAPTGMHKVFKTDLKGNVVFVLDFPNDAKDLHDGKLCYEDKETIKKTKVKTTTGEEEKDVKEVKPAAAFYVPTFTAFAPNGDFYVTDGYGAGYIHHYNIKGEYISSFGGKGNADDQTQCPHGIYCDTRDPAKPILVVADREHHRLQYFTLEGKLDHLVVNENGDNENGRLRRPCHFSQRGTEMVIPDLRGRVTILDKDNNAVAQLGDNPNSSQRANNGVKQADTTPGHFCCPHGATWDSHGNIFVAEWLPYGRFTKLRRLA
jgi:hypothetical protein